MWQNLFSMPDGVARCGVIKALCPGVREEGGFTVGEKPGEPAWIVGTWGSCSALGIPRSSTLLQKGGWELDSNTQTTSAIGYKPD